MVQPSEGVKTRAEIDTEVVRGLLLANGGGAVALLAFLSTVFGKESLSALAMPVIVALFIFHLGIVAAIIHNHYRRQCSLEYERHQFRPPPGTFLGCKLRQPRVCFISNSVMWASISLFLLGGCIVFAGVLCLLTSD